MVLRIATVEAGDKPAQGVTFPQPAFILNDILYSPLQKEKTQLYTFNIAITTFSVSVAVDGYYIMTLMWLL